MESGNMPVIKQTVKVNGSYKISHAVEYGHNSCAQVAINLIRSLQLQLFNRNIIVMEAKEILKASVLDIVFDGRNKEYGAYELRKHYNRRLLYALAGMAIVTSFLFLTNFLVNRSDGSKKQVMLVKDIQLEEVREEKKNEPLPPPPPPQAPIQKVEVTKFTPPRIVRDNEVKEEDKPPLQEKLEDTHIGTINQEGVKDEGIVAPPVSDAGKGVVEGPKPKAQEEDYEKTFVKVEIESEYPGGPAAWLRYLNRNFRYPDEGLNNEIQGVVLVRFIVDKEGNVSDVEAVSGPEEGGLRKEAMRVIRNSGVWTPAIQNGRKVKSFKQQPVIFKIASA
jgi:protein TonB